MIKSNLLDILRKFSAKELKEFGEYVRSPFFNKNESTIKLFNYLRKFAPDFNEKKLEKEYVYKKIFPGTAFNDGFMRTIMFNLANLTENYLSYNHFKNSNYKEKLSLLADYNERELNKLFEKTMRDVNEEISKNKIKDFNYYYTKYSIEDENLSYLQRIHYDKAEKFIKSTEIDNILNNLTYFYIIRILKYYVVILNTSSIFNIKFKTKLIEDTLANFKLELYDDIPLIKIYFYMVMMYLKEDEKFYFTKLKNSIGEIKDFINPEDLLESFINLENYCLRKIRKGKKEFHRDLSEIFKMELQYIGYDKSKKLSNKLYRAIVVNAMAIKDFDWAIKFMETYKDYITERIKDNTHNQCMALYYFAKGNYVEALQVSSRIKYEDIYQKYELKCLSAALYYELNMEEQLLASLDSFRHLISGDTLVPEERKANYIKFTRYIRKLVKIKNDFNEEEFEDLQFQIKKEKALLNDEWLLEKLDEIGKSKK